jgi:hypothetical protein
MTTVDSLENLLAKPQVRLLFCRQTLEIRQGQIIHE